MSKLLYVQGSPRGERSYSVRVADTFVEAWRVAHPDGSVETMNLFEADLPAFDAASVRARYKARGGGEEMTEEEATAWRGVIEVVDHFLAFDCYVFAVPMWNFGVPYRVKQYIDLLVQPGHTFSFSPETGFQGLLQGKRALAVFSRGAAYPLATEAAALDHQAPHMMQFLRFIGIDDAESLAVEPTLAGGPDAAREVLEKARDAARALAAAF